MLIQGTIQSDSEKHQVKTPYGYIDTDVKKALIKSASMESQEYWIKNMSCTALNLRHLLLGL